MTITRRMLIGLVLGGVLLAQDKKPAHDTLYDLKPKDGHTTIRWSRDAEYADTIFVNGWEYRTMGFGDVLSVWVTKPRKLVGPWLGCW